MSQSQRWRLNHQIYCKISNQLCEIKFESPASLFNNRDLIIRPRQELIAYSQYPNFSRYLEEHGLKGEDYHENTQEQCYFVPKKCFIYTINSGFCLLKEAQLTIIDNFCNSNGNFINKRVAENANFSLLQNNVTIFRIKSINFTLLSRNQFEKMFQTELVLLRRQLVDDMINKQKCKLSGEKRERVKIYKQQNQGQVQQDYIVVNREYQYLNELVVQQFFYQNSKQILWPSLQLQRVGDNTCSGEKAQFFKKQKQNDCNFELQNTVVKNMFKKVKDIIMGTISGTNVTRKRTNKNSSMFSRQHISFEQKKEDSIMMLIGTSKIMNDKVHACSLNKMNKSYLQSFEQNYVFSELVPLMNTYIRQLNSYKLQQTSVVKGDNFLGRLCSLRCDEKVEKLALGIRRDLSRGQNNILIRLFCQNCDELKWVSQSNLRVNLIMKPLSIKQIIKFSSLRLHYSYDKLIQLFYCGATNQLINSQRIFKPPLEALEDREKCPYCFYNIQRKQQVVYQCEQCERRWHFECCLQINNQHRLGYKMANIGGAREIRRWYCFECTPCNVCLGKTKGKNIKCSKCYKIYHQQCGKVQNMEIFKTGSRIFFCRACFSCSYCRELITERYEIDGSLKIVCERCYGLLANAKICSFCSNIEIKDEVIRICSNPFCQKIVHSPCDARYEQIKAQEGGDYEYRCPECRLTILRCILRWVVQELRKFDEYQYYYQPCYQQITTYEGVVEQPVCFMTMKDNIALGQYDTDSYHLISEDLYRLVRNALMFNMPQDDAYYRAKIIYIIGTIFLNRFRHYLDNAERETININLQKQFKQKIQDFYEDLFRNYFSYLMNYNNEGVCLEITYDDSFDQYFERSTLFNSQIFITHELGDGTLKLRVPKEIQLIDQLFKKERIHKSFCEPVRKKQCFYHPQDNFPIIYQCQQCWQTYCCIKRCFKHRTCSRCGNYGCGCDLNQCGCPYVKDAAISKRNQLKLSQMEMTEYYRYCLKCADKNLIFKNCQYCNKFCYYGYGKCSINKKYYHLNCIDKSKIGKLANYMWQMRLDGSKNTNDKLKGICCCRGCCSNERQVNQFKKVVVDYLKEKIQRINKVTEYVQLFKIIYDLSGIQMTGQQIVALLYKNYEQLELRQRLCDAIITSQQTLLIFSSQIKNLCQPTQKTLIFGNGFSDDKKSNSKIYLIQDQQNRLTSGLDIQLLENSKQIQQLVLQRNNRDLLNQYISSHKIQRNASFRKNNCLFDLKFSSSTKNNQEDMIVKQNSSRIFPAQNIQDNYFGFKEKQTFTINQKYNHRNFINEDKNLLFDKPIKYQCSKDTIFGTLSEVQQNNNFINSEGQLTKIKLITKYLFYFAKRIFQQSKLAPRRGNTFIFNHSMSIWNCKKFLKDILFEFSLVKKNEKWIFRINDEQTIVKGVKDIILFVRKVNKGIASQQMLIDFLGFNLKQIRREESWSDLFDTNVLENLSRKQRIDKIKQTYQILYQNEKENEKIYLANNYVGNGEVYYLKKRQSNKLSKPRQVKKQRLDFLVTRNDLKKDFPYRPEQLQLSQQDTQQHLDFDIVQQPDVVYVAPSKIDRLGLFANKNFKQNEIITEYVGQVISQAVADLRQKNYGAGCYMFGLQSQQNDRFSVIDATFIGNMTRYLNHSCSANCKTKSLKKKDTDIPWIIVYAIRDIEKFEELTYDYQFQIQFSEKLECKCKSVNCQKRLN